MDKTQLIQEIERKIYPNNNGEITGQNLQDVLIRIVEFAVDVANEQAGRKGEDGVGISNIATAATNVTNTRKLVVTLTNNEVREFPIFDGKDGAAGVQGPKGSNGKDGKDGTNGVDGHDGVDGRDGIDGKDGKDGKDGYEGRDGRDGKDGQDGRDGRDGRDGQDGRDGENGRDGLNGKDGKQGRAGAAVRGPYDYYAISAQTRWWCSGEEMEESPENTKWIDIVAKDQKYYACKIGYYGRLSPWEDVVEDHWQEGESFEFVATKLLLAKNASIDFLTGNEIYLRDRFGNITAGAAGGNGVSFWAGAEDPSDGPFKVYYDGRLVATDAQIKGAITANSLTLGEDTSIEDYVGGRINDYAENSGMNYNQVNEAIDTFLHDNDYIQGQVLTGYVTGDLFETWIQQWNASHSGQTLTDAEIEEMAHRIAGAEISNVISLTRNPDGSITHTMNIGGREYNWVTYDIGDYVLLGAMFSGETESGISKFIVSKQGLLQANNAIIYGKIYASEGYFHGSVSATDGYFRGSVSADNGYFKGRVEANEGYFKGDVTANSLTLGGSALDTIKGVVTDNSVDSATVKNYLTNFIETQISDVSSALTGYIDQASFDAWVAAWNAAHSGQTLTDEEIEALANRVVGAEISNVIGMTQNPDGSITHTINIGGREYSWVTYDIGDYVLLGATFSGMSGNELTSFVVSKNGLLQANNAIIYGKIYASEGYFHGSVSATDGYFRGSISADNGYFKGRVEANEGYFKNMSATNITMDNSFFSGNVYANSLTLGNNQTIEDYIGSQITGYAANSGMNYDQVNQAIREFLNERNYVGNSALTGYVTSGLFESWIAEWNAQHSGQTLTDEEIEALAERVVGAEISNVIGLTRNPDGSITHTMNIGGQEYNWVTYDAGDYMLLGAVFSGISGNELTKFIVSKNGLLQANNAVIYGKIYASEGYFHGSVSATDGYFKGSVSADNGYFKGRLESTEGFFKGSVSADNGYFKGDIVARSLKLGDGQTIQDYVDGKIASAATSGLDVETVNQLINDYLEASGITMDGYMTESAWTEWVNNWNATHPDSQIDEGVVSAIVRSELSRVFSETTSAGVTTHTAQIGDRSYTWKTVDTGDYLLVDTGLGELSSGSTGGFIISRNGLLEAYNALIYGKIYASEGYFKGSVSADNGYFRGSVSADNGYFHGDIVANSLRLGDQTIQDYVSGKVSAATGSEGLTTQDVNELISGAARDYQWVVLDDLGDYYVVGTPLGPNSALTIEKNGLLNAKNAIISGTVFATDGIFNGTVYADGGKFRGAVSADSGYFKGSVSADNGYFNGKIVAKEGQIGNVTITNNGLSGTNINITNEYMFGDNVAFKGSISATNGYFYGDVYADNGRFNGAITATSLTLVDGAEIDVTPEAIGIDTSQFIKVNSAITGVDGEVLISNRGLLQAKNAIISGSVYATSGYFKGDVRADSGYFKGDITANSLTLANNAYVSGTVYATNGKFENLTGKNLTMNNSFFSGNVYGNNAIIYGKVYADSGYFKGDITANSLTLASNASVSGTVYATSGKFNNVTATNFSATNSYFKGKIEADDGYFKGNITANSLTLGSNAAASVSGAINLDKFYKVGTTVGGSNSSVTISTNGLLTAKNAVISGSVYATRGVFNGKVYATGGEFSGAVKATSLQLGNNVISSIPDEDDFVKIDHKYGTTSSVTISTNGLLTAKNAVVSGTIYANRGVFNGTVYADDGEFNGAITATSLSLGSNAAASVSGAINLDKFYKLGNTVGGSNSSVTISTGGLLTAKNAVISGSVYATNGYFKGKVEANEGYFKGNVSAENGYFKGELKAATGSFSGAITATSLYLGGQNVTGVPSTDGFLQLGRAYNNMTVTTAGVLTAQNAVINGTVYANDGYFKGSISATNGHFSGVIDASDIILGGKSLRFSDGTDNTFEIANSPITIEYVPRTYYTQSYDNWHYNNPTNGLSGWTYGQLSITGSSYTVNIPACNIAVDVATYGESNTGQCMVCAVTWVTSSSTYYGSTAPQPSQCVAYSSSGWKTITGSGYANGTVEAPAVTKALNGTATGKTYYWGYKVWVEGYSAYWTNPYIRFSIPSQCVTVVASAADDKQFVRIGSNGIQIFLGNGFYFTAANDSEQGQVISFAGKVGNAMKYFKLDSSGLVLQQ
jgi:cytoskeletal protein CcmA (bactofilin family)